MKSIKLKLIGTLVAIIFSALVVSNHPAKAQAAVWDGNLNGLIVANGLFTGYSPQSLAGLIAVNNTLGNGAMNTSNLGDLIVLNGLFGSNWGWGWNNAAGLAGLIAINNMYGNR
jgi:hypothetical protein